MSVRRQPAISSVGRFGPTPVLAEFKWTPSDPPPDAGVRGDPL